MSTSPPATHARDVRATWWYTAVSIMALQVFGLSVWTLVVASNEPVPTTVLFLIGASGSTAAAVLLLVRYWREPLDDGEATAGRPVWPLVLAGIASAILVGATGGSLLLGTALAAQSLCLIRWRARIRIRLVLLLVAMIIAAWVIEATRLNPAGHMSQLAALGLLVAMLPPVSATSLWWWDIVRELDRARRAEGRLAAAQERLRLANDLHDLQGHHLQVIALQLELAEKMLARDPAAAAQQVRLARTSVDEARRGTRELATRFRGVPLPDELANAADLLRAAGLRVDLVMAPDAADAPADVLGPVVRECTTNVLKHGGGGWAALSLLRDRGAWVFTLENDARSTGGSGGSGLAGIAERVESERGAVETKHDGDRFRVTVSVPEDVVS